MTPRAKPVYRLTAKMRSLMDTLYAAGQLQAPSFGALAEATGLLESTLRNTDYQGKVSARVEKEICRVGGFEHDDPTWCDSRISDKKRAEGAIDYPGRDTPEAFTQMLAKRWQLATKTFRALGDRPTNVDRDIACHELSDSSQAATRESAIQLFLEADFEPIQDIENGLKYGFERARLRVDIICQYGSRADIRWGEETQAEKDRWEIVPRGTAHQPSWDIRPSSSSDQYVLDGVVITRENPLMSISDFGEGTRINSTLSVNLYDVRIIGTEQVDVDQIHPNKRALVEYLLAKEFAKTANDRGTVAMSFHSLEIRESLYR